MASGCGSRWAYPCAQIDPRAAAAVSIPASSPHSLGQWVERAQTILIVGATGVGKTWLACALAHKACRLWKSALYARVPRLLEELRIPRGDGTHKRRLIARGKLDVLVLDDWALQPLEAYGREDLLEIIDDRAE